MKIELNHNLITVLLTMFILIIMVYGVFFAIPTLLIFIGILIAFIGINFSYRYIVLGDNELVFKTLIGEEIRVPLDSINHVTLTITDSVELLSFEVNEGNTIKTYRMSPKGYVVDKKTKHNVIQEIQSFAEKNNICFRTIKENSIPDVELGNSLRFLVYPPFIIFLGMMYVDMKVLTAVHFDTMNFIVPTVVIVLVTSILCYLFFKLRKEKRIVICSLTFGMVWGILFSSVTQSYIHWYDENRAPDIVTYYPMTLDDYDSYSNQQRWIIESKEAEDLIGQKRLFLFGVKRDRIMNNKLIEGKVYSVPIAVGMFNDVFIPQDGFDNAEEITVD